MTEDSAFFLRKRFFLHIRKKWILNNHSLEDISCVYLMISFNIPDYNVDIVYVGSSTKLKSRYRSHKIPEKIQESGNFNLMYFLPMDKGFYDYEIKLIKKLQPIFNKQHK